MSPRSWTTLSRRSFLRCSPSATPLLALPGLVGRHVLPAAGQPGANDRLRVGFIGLGGRARWILL